MTDNGERSSSRGAFGRVPAGIASLAGHALLFEMALETYLAGTPGRWWIAGITLAWLVVAVLLCWRFARLRHGLLGYPGFAVSVALLLALMLAATLAGEGTTGGIVMFGQPTSVVLQGITGVAVVVSVVVLLRADLHVPIRVALAAVGVYALVALGFGIAGDVSYAELLRGGSFWTWLPYWLQGATVGALLLVPLGGLFLALQVLAGTRPRRASTRIPVVVHLMLVFGVAVFSVKGDVDVPRDTGPTFADAAAPSRPTPDERDRRLRQIFERARTAMSALPRTTLSAEAIVDRVGTEPRDLLSWVRQRTSLVPYHGALRGSGGVLMDRVGNSLDRALLLHRLLRVAEHEARLAHTRLPAADAKTLADRIPERLEDVDDRMDWPSADEMRSTLRNGYVSTDEVEAMERMAALNDEIRDRIRERTRSQTERLLDFVGDELRSQQLPQSDGVEDALRNHWWVQVRNESGWTDLDPTSEEVGSTRHAADEHMAPEDLKHTLRHRVGFRVGITQAAEEHIVLEHELVPSSLLGTPILLQFMPLNWPADASIVGGGAERTLRERLPDQRTWLPVLMVGGEAIHDGGIDLDDGVIVQPTEGVSGAAQEQLEGFTDALESMPAGADDQPAAGTSEPRVSAVWLEVTSHVPGKEARRHRRVLHRHSESEDELAGPLDMMREIRVVITAAEPSAEYLLTLALDNILSHRDLATAAVEGRFGDYSEEDMAAQIVSADAMASHLHRLTWRRKAWRSDDLHAYQARPNIFLHHAGLQSTASRLVQWDEIDIVENSVEILHSGVDVAAPGALEQGVLDTNVESAELGGDEWEETANVANLFAVSPDSQWSLLGPGDSDAVAELDLPARTRHLVTGLLQRGRLVVAPQSAVSLGGKRSVGFWSIDPVTGQTLGLSHNGHGSEFAERLIVTLNILIPLHNTTLSAVASAKKCGGDINCFGCTIASAVFSVSYTVAAALLTGGASTAVQAGVAAGGAGAGIGWSITCIATG